MPQRIARRFVVTAQNIDVKNVFPRPPAHGAGFDLTQADIPKRKDAQRLEQSPWNILHAESQRSLVRPCRYPPSLADQKEAGKVALVILHPGFEDGPTVH